MDLKVHTPRKFFFLNFGWRKRRKTCDGPIPYKDVLFAPEVSIDFDDAVTQIRDLFKRTFDKCVPGKRVWFIIVVLGFRIINKHKLIAVVGRMLEVRVESVEKLIALDLEWVGIESHANVPHSSS